MAVTKNVLREKVAKLNAKLEDHTRLRISVQSSASGYTIYLGESGNSYELATGLHAQDADNYLEGMRSMFSILKGGR